MALMTNVEFSTGSIRTALTHWVADVREALDQRAVYTKTLAELDALDDRELADLGLSRYNLKTIAREAAYGK